MFSNYTYSSSSGPTRNKRQQDSPKQQFQGLGHGLASATSVDPTDTIAELSVASTFGTSGNCEFSINFGSICGIHFGSVCN